MEINMESKKGIKIQIIEPFILFDNLAQGVLAETDEDILEWATENDLDISDVATENKNHLKMAIKLARQKLVAEPLTYTFPQSVDNLSDAKKVLENFGQEFRIAARNGKTSNEADFIRRANQILKLHWQSAGS